jgi:hypothetical protein
MHYLICSANPPIIKKDHACAMLRWEAGGTIADLRYKAVEGPTSHLHLLLSYVSLISFKLLLSFTTLQNEI